MVRGGFFVHRFGNPILDSGLATSELVLGEYLPFLIWGDGTLLQVRVSARMKSSPYWVSVGNVISGIARGGGRADHQTKQTA